MKRTLSLVGLVILLLLLGGAAWYFLVYSKSQGPVTAAEFVPSSSPVFLWLPKIPQSIERFKATPVYAMWQEQAIQAALDKLNPLKNGEAAGVPPEAKKIWELAGPLWSSFKGEAFLAVTSFQSEPEPQVEGIGGFQIGPDPAAFQAWVAQVKTSFPELKWQEKTHPAMSYFSTEASVGPKKIIFCVAQWQDWVLVGAGESAFQQMLDRIHAGKPDPALTLSGQESFKQFLATQPQGFDAVTYVNPAPLLAAARKSLEKSAPEQLGTLKAYEGMQAVILTSSIDGPNFRDEWDIRMPKSQRPDYGASELPLKGVTARFTTPQTLVYTAQNIDISKTLDQLRQGAPDEKKMIEDGIAKVNEALAGISLNLEKDITPKLGPELGFILDWGPGKSFPDLSLALEHKDQAMVRKLMDFLIQVGGAMSGGKVQIQNADIAGDPTYVFAIPMSPIAPAIWVGKDVLLLTLNGTGLETMVKRSGNGLLGTEPYKTLAGRSKIKNPVSLAYVDTEQLVMYSHGALSNLLPMVAGLTGQPGLAQALPPVENLKPYLGRWLVLSAMDEAGVRGEGLYEKGHPLIYAAAGAALIADFAKALAPLAASAMASANAPAQPPADPTAAAGSEVDASMVMQDLVDLDDAITTWAKDKKQPEGTPVSWNDIVSYLPENSQVATRVGLDPLGNAYLLGKTGPTQVILSAPTQNHFDGTVPENFWGKFTNKTVEAQGELPKP